MTVSDPSSGLLAFLIRFDSLEFNSLLASHIHCFGPPFVSFLRFSVPAEGLPLLEGLFKTHGDFTSKFRGGMFLGNILIVVAEKALARAHKVLQDLKIKRQLILSSLTTSIVPPEGFLALYLSLFFCVCFFFFLDNSRCISFFFS